MYLKYRDEVFEWEGKMPTATSEDYIKKNLDMIKDLYKEQQKNG
jgi:hypothetical protein